MIESVEADDLSACFPNEMLARMHIRLRDGSQYRSPKTPAKGDPATAMTAEEFRAKCQLLVSTCFSQQRIDAIRAAVSGLEPTSDCTILLPQVL